MLIKIILIYLLIGAILDLIEQLILKPDYSDKVKTFGDLCYYIIRVILVIIVWPIIIIECIVLGIKLHD